MKNQSIRRLTVGLLVCAGAFLACFIWRNNGAQRSPAPLAASHANRNGNLRIVKHAPAWPQHPALSSTTAGNFQVLDDPDRAPVWAVKFGGEFWRHHTPSFPGEANALKASTLVNPPFSLGDVIERVSHAL